MNSSRDSLRHLTIFAPWRISVSLSDCTVRSFPGMTDEEKITASFDNGVLTITAPKSPKAEAQAKRIPISTGQTVH